MNPFLSLRPLTPHIEHPVRQRPKVENCFCDTSGLQSRTQNILVRRTILSDEQPIQRLKEATGHIESVTGAASHLAIKDEIVAETTEMVMVMFWAVDGAKVKAY